MKRNTLVLGTALALMLGTATTNMSPAHAAKGDKKAAKAGNKAGGKRDRPMQTLNGEMLGKVLGKPLTAEQKTALDEANKSYGESVAKAVGMTVPELKAKIAEYRKANPGGKGGGGARKDAKAAAQ